ncbi:hypothetical protein ACV07N_06870 [Roseivirga echinicomitans]
MKTIATTKVMTVLILVVWSRFLAQAQDDTYLNQDIKAVATKQQSDAEIPNGFAWDSKSLTDVTKHRTYKTKGLNSWENNFDLDRYYPKKGTQSFVNIYLGLNNYLQDGDLPSSNSLISLNPLTSWYGALSLDHVTRIIGPLYLDWGVGASLQDFSFENTRVEVVVDRNTQSVSFEERIDRVGKKSKISITHLNLHFVPTFSFGKNSSFRFGAGVYGGYRIGSHAKYKYDDANGDSQKDKFKNSLYINPFKYGLRAQLGWNGFDIFFNYDISELFEEEANAPRLNPVTFGVIF